MHLLHLTSAFLLSAGCAAAQDSLKMLSLRTFYGEIGGLYAGGKLFGSLSGTAVFRKGWGIAGGYSNSYYRSGLPDFVKDSHNAVDYVGLRAVKEVRAADSPWRFQFELGPSLTWYQYAAGYERNEGVFGAFYTANRRESRKVGIAAGATVIYAIGPHFGITAGVHGNYSRDFPVNGMKLGVAFGGLDLKPRYLKKYLPPRIEPLSPEKMPVEMLKNERSLANRKSKRAFGAGILALIGGVAGTYGGMKLIRTGELDNLVGGGFLTGIGIGAGTTFGTIGMVVGTRYAKKVTRLDRELGRRAGF